MGKSDHRVSQVIGLFALTAAFLNAGSHAVAEGPDVTVCRLYDLKQFGRVGDTVGLSLATTSLNVGDEDMLWFANPEPLHPFIAMNLYRLHENRFEQIGQSWVKHGFFAESDEDCGMICQDPGSSTYLGPGCTDTYGAGLNSFQYGLGPRSEINPWTGEFVFEGSHLDDHPESHNTIDHRLQVHDADLDPSVYADAVYVMEGYYVTSDDVDHSNSSSWKTVIPVGVTGGTWTFESTPEEVSPDQGLAIYAWDAERTIIWGVDDGRCLLAYDVTDLGDGTWRYEYALYNLDMDREVGSFSIPIAEGTELTNIGFHDVDSHGQDYSNEDWVVDEADGAITWSTESYDVNPLANSLRWGTLYNFRFDANAGPKSRTVTLGLYKPGSPTELTVTAVGPTTPGDCNENGVADADDLAQGTSPDCNANGLPDECDPDCDGTGTPDDCDLADGSATDCDGNQQPDACDLEDNDCNANDILDNCETKDDCNGNFVPDVCELAEGDCNGDGVLDVCEPDGGYPNIITQPVGGTACTGDDFTFTVEASGAEPLTYVWFKDNFILIQFGPEPTLILTGVEESDEGVYFVLVNDQCSLGVVFSDSVYLAVDACLPAPNITSADSAVTHGLLGELTLSVSLVNNQGPDGLQPATDPRMSAGGKIVVVFDRPMDPLTAEDPSNISVIGQLSGTVDSSAIATALSDTTVLTITFPGLLDAKLATDRYLFDLSLMKDIDGTPVSAGEDPDFELRVLTGDVNGDGIVDPLDSGAVLARFGQNINLDPRYDVNIDGTAIDPLDVGAVLARFGNSAP